jgi:hypothetical protein
MTTPADALFEQLRSLVLTSVPSAEQAFAAKPTLVPIEATDDGGWVCLSQAGEVGFLDAAGHFDPHTTFAVSKTALMAALRSPFPWRAGSFPRLPTRVYVPGAKASAESPVFLGNSLNGFAANAVAWVG